jgi:glycerol kinase
MPHVLAIDQSTSATKALLYDARGQLLDKRSLDHRQIYPHPSWVEHDAEEIWQNTLQVIGQMKTGEAQCLSITNQRETVVVFERGTGRPLHNAIVWQDHRGDQVCAQLKQAGHEQMVNQKTGLRIDTYFSASKLTWLLRSNLDVARKFKEGSALVGTIDAYLIYRLTGGKVFATDHTNASRTLLFDISNLRWDAQLCELFQVPANTLPEVRSSTARFGMAQVGGRDVPICGVMGDSQASLFAHRCFNPGMAKATLGTGSSVLLNVGPELKLAGEGACSTIAWTHEGKPTYCFEGIISYAAATIQWLKDQLMLISDPAETEEAAMSVLDNGGVYFVPAFAGLSAPYWSPKALAGIVGMTLHTNRRHVIRAALESIAYQLRDVLEMMKSTAKVDLKTINADGGTTRNKFLMQFIADITGLEVTAAQMLDCSPLGAALAGMLGTNMARSFDELLKLPREVVTYRPTMPPARALELHLGWKRAVRQVLAGTQ